MEGEHEMAEKAENPIDRQMAAIRRAIDRIRLAAILCPALTSPFQ